MIRLVPILNMGHDVTRGSTVRSWGTYSSGIQQLEVTNQGTQECIAENRKVPYRNTLTHEISQLIMQHNGLQRSEGGHQKKLPCPKAAECWMIRAESVRVHVFQMKGP